MSKDDLKDAATATSRAIAENTDLETFTALSVSYVDTSDFVKEKFEEENRKFRGVQSDGTEHGKQVFVVSADYNFYGAAVYGIFTTEEKAQGFLNDLSDRRKDRAIITTMNLDSEDSDPLEFSGDA